MTSEYRSYLDFATETAYLAGRLTLGYFGSGIRPDMKADDTPVTLADRRSEELIRSRIERRYPHHAIVGEEFGATEREGADHRWFIDPIDGTKSFVRGVALYGVLLGLEIAGTIEVGVAYFPALDEMVAAASGEGCWWNGRPAHVSEVTDLKRATVSFSDVANFARYDRAQAWERVQAATYHRAGWGDAYGHALVATGRVDLMMEAVVSAWDCGPFPVILREAGGYFGDWRGNQTIFGGEALSTTRTLLPQVLALIENTGDKG